MKLSRLNQEMRAFFADLYEGESKPLVLGEGQESAPRGACGRSARRAGSAQGESPLWARRAGIWMNFCGPRGLDRAQLYITNVVKIRPTRVSDAGRIVNRPPTREEIELFLPWLRRELAVVKAPLVVTLGNVALKALAGRERTIGVVHGQLLSVEGMRIFPPVPSGFGTV